MCFVFILEQTAICATYSINRDEKCLQRGTDWVFKCSSLRFVCKGLIYGKLRKLNEMSWTVKLVVKLYAVPTLYLCVLYLSKNKQRLVPLTA